MTNVTSVLSYKLDIDSIINQKNDRRENSKKCNKINKIATTFSTSSEFFVGWSHYNWNSEMF